MSCKIGTSRETLIKMPDAHVAVIPLIDNKGHLEDVATRKHYPITKEDKIFAQSRAPVKFHLVEVVRLTLF